MEPISLELTLCARRCSQPSDTQCHLNFISVLWANVIYSLFKWGSWSSERLSNLCKATQPISAKDRNRTWLCLTLGQRACPRRCQCEVCSLTFIIHTNSLGSSTYVFHSRGAVLGSLAGSALEGGWERRREGKEVELVTTSGRRSRQVADSVGIFQIRLWKLLEKS